MPVVHQQCLNFDSHQRSLLYVVEGRLVSTCSEVDHGQRLGCCRGNPTNKIKVDARICSRNDMVPPQSVKRALELGILLNITCED